MPLVTEESDLKGGVAIRRNMAGSGTSVPSSTATSNPQGLVNRGFNLREDSDFKGGSGIRRNMAGKGVISSIATNTPTIPTTGGRGFIIPEVGFGSGTPAVTNIQAQLNRSSKLIDIGGNPIGQLLVSPLPSSVTSPPLPPSYVIRNIGNEEVATPLIETVSRITIPAEASRLESLHVEDGFLDSYYAQLTSNSGLGIRNTTPTQTQVLGFSKTIKPTLRTVNSIGRNINQTFARLGVKTKFNTDTNLDFNVAPDRKEPFVIRGIGQRWGIDRVQKPDSALNGVAGLVQVDKAAYKGKDVVKSYFNLIDDVGRGMVGRTPSVFLDRYFADVKRINAATNSLDFLTRGSTFVNNQDKLQKRNPFQMVTTTLYDVGTNDHQVDFTADTFLPDPFKGKVKQFSKGTKLHLNPRAYNPLSVFSVPGVLGINRMSYVDLGTLVSKGTLIDFISAEVLESIAEAATDYITDTVVTRMKSFAKESPWLAKTKQQLEDQSNSLEEIVDKSEKLGKKLQKTAALFAEETGLSNAPIGKANASKIMKSLPGFGKGDSRGQDKVNLIPYGLDSDGKKELYELDWIPFKFRDVRNDKKIVFRAILSGITDTFSPEYSPEKYVGRPDSVYVYQGTSREISFTFDVYPKSQEELPVLWEKLNYLAGLTYPHWADGNADGGGGMISPFSELTIGQMYTNSPGYISALTYTVQDNGTWETTFAKLPKYVQVSCTFIYVGRRLPSATQKHFETPWVGDKEYQPGVLNKFQDALSAATSLTKLLRSAGDAGRKARIAQKGIPVRDLSQISTKELIK